jgi:hypothetical protein
MVPNNRKSKADFLLTLAGKTNGKSYCSSSEIGMKKVFQKYV